MLTMALLKEEEIGLKRHQKEGEIVEFKMD